MKLSSPGFSLHRARRTHGWNTGSWNLWARFFWPPGAARESNKSGTPDTFAVKTIVPCTRAEIGLPEGAIVTDKDSTISTYSSLDVCRTPRRRQGMAGADAPFTCDGVVNEDFSEFEGPRIGEALFGSCGILHSYWSAHHSQNEQEKKNLNQNKGCEIITGWHTDPGKPTPTRSLSIQPGISTISCRAFGSVLQIIPPSHISFNSCATTS